MSKDWKNIINLVKDKKADFRQIFTDDDLRIRFQFFCVFIIFSIVSLVMTVVNAITGFKILMFTTIFFSILNIINFVLCLINDTCEKIARYLFAIEALVLFAFFLIFGEPEGFSIIWIALLPACGMILFRTVIGSILCGIEFCIIIFFFWTPLGQGLLLYNYSASFMLRFPLLYFAFYLVGFFFEFIRNITQRELQKTRDNYKYLYAHDALTGLYNRHGFNSIMDTFLSENKNKQFSFAILDLDFFKRVNDLYGHLYGDEVLNQSAKRVKNVVGEDGIVCRWGGEEVAILFKNSYDAFRICNKLLNIQRTTEYSLKEGQSCIVTVSIGLVHVAPGKQVFARDLVATADENLYMAKKNGRDQIIESSIN